MTWCRLLIRDMAYRLRLTTEQYQQLVYIAKLNPISQLYRVWEIPKSDGGTRFIHSPVEPLLSIQRAIVHEIMDPMPQQPWVHGFVSGRSIFTNAVPHLRARSAFCIDLANAFGTTSMSIHTTSFYLDVREACAQPFQVTAGVLELMAFLTDFVEGGRRFLPQGAPTSPAIFNYNCRWMDEMIGRIAVNIGGAYTRYADNLTFSSPNTFVPDKVIRAVLRRIREAGFKINPKKTRCYCNANRPNRPIRLPGLNLIDGDVSLPQETVRKLRGALYRAGLVGNWNIKNGIEGFIIQVYGFLPPQFHGVYNRGAQHALGR